MRGLFGLCKALCRETGWALAPPHDYWPDIAAYVADGQIVEAKRITRAARGAVGDARRIAHREVHDHNSTTVALIASALGVRGRRDLIEPHLRAIEAAIVMVETTLDRIDTVRRIALDDRTGAG